MSKMNIILCCYIIALVAFIGGKVFAAQGTVKWFNAEKGYGFIKPKRGGEDIFFRRNNIDELTLPWIKTGRPVFFKTLKAKKGVEAIKVRKMN